MVGELHLDAAHESDDRERVLGVLGLDHRVRERLGEAMQVVGVLQQERLKVHTCERTRRQR